MYDVCEENVKLFLIDCSMRMNWSINLRLDRKIENGEFNIIKLITWIGVQGPKGPLGEKGPMW